MNSLDDRFGDHGACRVLNEPLISPRNVWALAMAAPARNKAIPLKVDIEILQ
jgi:hypothetical protein